MIRLSSDPVISFEESAEKANERTVIAWPVGYLKSLMRKDFDAPHVSRILLDSMVTFECASELSCGNIEQQDSGRV
jgi:hypothetical protein